VACGAADGPAALMISRRASRSAVREAACSVNSLSAAVTPAAPNDEPAVVGAAAARLGLPLDDAATAAVPRLLLAGDRPRPTVRAVGLRLRCAQDRAVALRRALGAVGSLELGDRAGVAARGVGERCSSFALRWRWRRRRAIGARVEASGATPPARAGDHTSAEHVAHPRD